MRAKIERYRTHEACHMALNLATTLCQIDTDLNHRHLFAELNRKENTALTLLPIEVWGFNMMTLA